MAERKSLERLDSARLGQALDLIVESFVSDSVLHHALGVDADLYRVYVEQWLEPTVTQGLSWICLDELSGRVCGCILAVDYDVEIPPGADASMGIEAAAGAELQPMKALLAELEAAYEAVRDPGDRTVLVDLAVVSPRFRGRGMYRQLREAVHDDGRAQGFTHVVGELSSAATQRVCLDHFGHRVVAEVAYNAFEFEGAKPFADITDPVSVIMVEGRL